LASHRIHSWPTKPCRCNKAGGPGKASVCNCPTMCWSNDLAGKWTRCQHAFLVTGECSHSYAMRPPSSCCKRTPAELTEWLNIISSQKKSGSIFPLYTSSSNGAYVWKSSGIRIHQYITWSESPRIYVIPRCLPVAVLLLNERLGSLAVFFVNQTDQKQGCCNRSLVRYQQVRRLAHGSRAKGAKHTVIWMWPGTRQIKGYGLTGLIFLATNTEAHKQAGRQASSSSKILHPHPHGPRRRVGRIAGITWLDSDACR